MKKLLLVFILCSCINIFAQVDTTKVFFVKVDSSQIGVTMINKNCEQFLPKNIHNKGINNTDYFFIEDIKECENSKYFKIFNGQLSFYVPANKLNFTDENQNIDNATEFYKGKNDNEKEIYYNFIFKKVVGLNQALETERKIDSIKLKIKNDSLIQNKFFSYEKYGIAILKAYPTENYSMTGAKFKILNFSKKTIKYITFNFYGKNAVKDKVLGGNKSYIISRKGIGPVEYLNTAEWNYDTVWLTDIVQTLELVSVKIEYMDKTFKTIPILNKYYMDEDLLDEFNSLLENLNK